MTAAAQDRRLVTQVEFARECGVSKARVTQWKQAGQIPAEAFVETDAGPRLDADLAARALERTRHPGQALANGAKTRLPSAGDAGAVETITDRYQAEKLREIEFRNRAAAKREAETAGLYVRTEHHQAAMARVTATILRELETAVPSIANALAATGAPVREVRRVLGAQLREVRARIQGELLAAAEAEPDTVTDELLGRDEPTKGEA